MDEGKAPHILNLGLHGGEWTASQYGCFTPLRDPGI
jgi:hypothetical protein